MSEAIKSKNLVELFGIYRAEWLSDALFGLFTKPSYFPELETPRPCVLEGGRGTGKTTVLRCLSYDGRFALEGEQRDRVREWRYFGFYYKVNTNSVRAFEGDDLSDRQWQKLFAHYLNLILCGRVAEFLSWYRDVTGLAIELPATVCSEVAETLFCDHAETQDELLAAIEKGIRRFEGWVNNINPDDMPKLSMQQVVVDTLCSTVLDLPEFRGKHLFFIIDEFESLLDDQQAIVNSLVKHCGPGYTFKIGVRELGWRRRSTLNDDEQLQSPADYERIDINQRLNGDQFTKFATEVCRLRAAERFPEGLDLEAMLPALAIEEEAELLGVDAKSQEVVNELRMTDRALVDAVSDAKPLELALLQYWSRTQRLPLAEVALDWRKNPETWRERYHNYRVPLLFTLRGNRPGLRKYYSGWRTFTLLAGNNIRYLLQLVGEALRLQLENGLPADGEPISPEIQTKAAIAVGGRNVKELEGLGVHGGQLTRLVLSLGRLFETLAREPEHKRPETTRFVLPEDEPLDDVEDLLRAAVMHLALSRRVSSQRTDLDLKAYDYAVHPIFSAFFYFSHRSMRKIRLSPDDIRRLMLDPKRTIREIVGSKDNGIEAPLPDQLRLFENFYGRD